MEPFEQLGAFYLGRPYDLEKREPREGLVLYDSQDLVTHAVCVGMTGSGKTGLCLALIEEALLDGVPVLAIDPKGDLGNLCLTFPGLSAAEFAPWVNAEDATREGQTPEQYAAAQAEMWKQGLAGWGEDGARIQRLRDAADVSIYTPGSDAGLPLAVLGSLAAPPDRSDPEAMRDAVTTVATGVLSLAGIEGDPMRSREHVLVSSLLQAAWSEGRDLDLAALISQVQAPPFERVGVLDLESFFPADDRFALAMALNTVLAAPGFDMWRSGEPLDVGRLLFTPEGRPRCSIVSIAHLSDAERMTVVTLLLNAAVGWMRAQPGTSSLRALLYMDEVFGFFPPVAEPPSKRPLLTLLKQARAYGLGIVLATQNPVDLDYKGLSNAGTWLIGRLQAERDKQRLLEGLEGAGTERFDRAETERTIAGLGKRIFLMHNVHETAPVVFETRWAMSYLRGPLTRDQIAALMAERKAAAPPPPAPAPGTAPVTTPGAAGAGTAAAPTLDPDIPRTYLPVRGAPPAGASIVYRPFALGAAAVHISDRKHEVDSRSQLVALAPIGDGAVSVDWAQSIEAGVAVAELAAAGTSGAAYEPIPATALKTASYRAWQRDLVDWAVATQGVELLASARLKVTSRPGEDEGAFRARIALAGRETRDTSAEKLRARYEPKLAALEERIRKAQQAVSRESEQARGASVQTVISLGATVLGSLLGRKKVSAGTVGRATSVLRGAGRTMDQRGDVGRARETVETLKERLAELEAEFAAESAEIDRGADAAAEPLDRVQIAPKKAGVDVQLVALAFAPHWRDAGGVLTPAWR